MQGEQPLQGMQLKEKEGKKDLAIWINIKAFNQVNREQLNILKNFIVFTKNVWKKRQK